MDYADVTIMDKTGWNGGLGSAISEVDLRHIAQVTKAVKKQVA